MQNPTPWRFTRASGIAAVALSSVLLAACASGGAKQVSVRKHSKEYFPESVFGVKASPRVTNLRTNLPRGGGRDQLGKPYVVRGKWYYPKEDKNYRKVGGASWYGDAFHGRLTANGEIYDMTHLTAAHPTMPLPSYARVTNLDNGSSVIVRVNDRGPYSDGRIIDLSHRAAEMLDYAHGGLANVRVEYVGRAPLDGRDEKYLMASFRPGNGKPDPSVGLPSGVMIAMEGTQPKAARPAAIPFPIEPAPRLPTLAAVSPGAVDLPTVGPIAPQRPDSGTQVAFAAMSYAAKEVVAPRAALAALDGLSGTPKPDAAYVAAATLSTRSEAEALADDLRMFGEAAVRKEGRKAYTVTLRSDSGTSVDALLQAAWANGAPDAIAVRD